MRNAEYGDCPIVVRDQILLQIVAYRTLCTAMTPADHLNTVFTLVPLILFSVKTFHFKKVQLLKFIRSFRVARHTV